MLLQHPKVPGLLGALPLRNYSGLIPALELFLVRLANVPPDFGIFISHSDYCPKEGKSIS